MSDENDAHLLSEALGAMLTHCREAGFVVPLHMALIACNGSMLYTRYDDDPDDPEGHEHVPTVLTGYSEGDVLSLPINIIITDSNGDGARMNVTNEGSGKFAVLH